MAAKQDTTSLSLPNDVGSCHDMIEGLLQTLAEREGRVHELESIVDQLIRERFGPKRERYVDPDQQQLFDNHDTDHEKDSSADTPAAEQDNETSQIDGQRCTHRMPKPGKYTEIVGIAHELHVRDPETGQLRSRARTGSPTVLRFHRR